MDIILLLSKILARIVRKKKKDQEKTAPFLTRSVSWILNQTVLQIQENTAPWPEFGRGC